MLKPVLAFGGVLLPPESRDDLAPTRRLPVPRSLSGLRRRLGRRPWSRAAGLLATWAGFVALFFLLQGRMRGAGALVSIPVLVAGISYGRGAGIAAGLFAIPLNMVLYLSAGRGLGLIVEGAPGLAMMVVVGGVVGWLRDLRFLVARETLGRLRAEHATKIARRSEMLANQEARLLRADRLAAVGTIASGVSHEINNPLAVVVANLAYLRRSMRGNINPGDFESSVGDALVAAERIRTIVSGLRSFAEGDAESRQERCDVVDLLERTLALARHEVERRGTLVADLAPVPLAWGDDSRLAQVFLNLLVNAAQALPAGHKENNQVRVSTSVDFDGHVVVEIRDTGAGIPPENLACIFDPFFSTKPAGTATGLGLSVSLGIVRSLGGEILVDSEPGEGSAFRVVLAPATGSDQAEEAAQRIAPPSRQVKGALFVDYVRMLRVQKTEDISKDLRPEDLEYLRTRIDPGTWYPMATFERMGLAILGAMKPNMEMVGAWGYSQMDALRGMNPELVVAGDARSTLLRFRTYRASFFDFPALAIAAVSEGAAMVRISYGMNAQAEQAAANQTLGAFRRMIELAGATDVTAWFSTQSWAGDAETTLQLRWSDVNERR